MTPDSQRASILPKYQSLNGFKPLSLVVETVAFIGALGWLYVAIIGVVRPNDLPGHIVWWIPVRRDTVGIACFGLSAAGFFWSRLIHPTHTGLTSKSLRAAHGDERAHTLWRVLFSTLFVYSTTIVIYLMVGTVCHPETLAMALTHLIDWPTERVTLMLGFVASMSSFIVLRASTHTSGYGLEYDEDVPK